MSEHERWLPVVGQEGKYEVSDQGRVRSLDTVQVYSRRDQYSGTMITVERKRLGRVLRPAPKLSGHVSVVLGRGNSRLVHALVLAAFVGPRPEGMESLHRNGNPADNRLENLRYGTRSENLLDAVEHGAKPVGSRHHQAKLTENDIPIIRDLLKTNGPSAIGRMFGVNETTIRQVRDCICWKHVKEGQQCL